MGITVFQANPRGTMDNPVASGGPVHLLTIRFGPDCTLLRSRLVRGDVGCQRKILHVYFSQQHPVEGTYHVGHLLVEYEEGLKVFNHDGPGMFNF